MNSESNLKNSRTDLNKSTNQNYHKDQIEYPNKLASDNKYQDRVRNVDADTPARFNADARRLFGASGCAGKVAVFALRLDTYPKPKQNQVFILAKQSDVFWGNS